MIAITSDNPALPLIYGRLPKRSWLARLFSWRLK